ncbi:MAG: DUF1028 domain-containing protein [Staphylothermus sp.]|nr:DUF1028 domain-containing protein [Staphylothermus sp.]
MLYLLENHYTPKQAVEAVLAGDPRREHRQIGVLNAKGEVFAYTGEKCIPYAGHIIGEEYTVQGNILIGEEVLEAMASAFEKQRVN